MFLYSFGTRIEYAIFYTKHKVFCGNLHYDVTREVLQNFFKNCANVTLPMSSGKNGGFAFLEFKNEDDYESALAKTGNTLNGRKITVSQFKERAKKKDKFQETSIVKYTIIHKYC